MNKSFIVLLFLCFFIMSCSLSNNVDQDANNDGLFNSKAKSKKLFVLNGAANISNYTNVALHKDVYVSSEYNTDFVAANATDGDLTSVWGSKVSNNNEYIYVDLGAVKKINALTLQWYPGYFSFRYQVHISNNGKYWIKAYEELNGNGDEDTLVSGDFVETRYVGIYIIGKSNAACGLREFEVYGYESDQTPTPTATPVITPTPTPTTFDYGIMFDDFNYQSSSDSALINFNWEVRSGGGGPGPANCTWSPANIEFFNDPDNVTNRLMRLKASTSGPDTTTVQAEINHVRKYLEGTYAARVRFTDDPFAGWPDGDEVIETFFTITPLDYPMDPAYSEVDFEYLANGGWGSFDHSLWMTTWETYSPDPWIQDSISDRLEESYAGWHTLVFVIKNGRVKYYVDGVLTGDHGDKYYPESLMSINFNLWFISGGMDPSPTSRTYVEDVDWVFHAQDKILTTSEVLTNVNYFRANHILRYDTVIVGK